MKIHSGYSSMERVWKCDLCGKHFDYSPCHFGDLELCNGCGFKIGENVSKGKSAIKKSVWKVSLLFNDNLDASDIFEAIAKIPSVSRGNLMIEKLEG